MSDPQPQRAPMVGIVASLGATLQLTTNQMRADSEACTDRLRTGAQSFELDPEITVRHSAGRLISGGQIPAQLVLHRPPDIDK